MFHFFKSQGSIGKEIEKPIGWVTHFYSGLGVAIVKFSKPVALGTKLHFKGATTDFTDTVQSIQYNHQAIEEAKAGQEVGIKVKDKVREGDAVYLVA
jgi:putative protease